MTDIESGGAQDWRVEEAAATQAATPEPDRIAAIRERWKPIFDAHEQKLVYLDAKHYRLASQASEAFKRKHNLTKPVADYDFAARIIAEAQDYVAPDLAYLLAEVDRLREALSWYADEANYVVHDTMVGPVSDADLDEGECARAALAGKGGVMTRRTTPIVTDDALRDWYRNNRQNLTPAEHAEDLEIRGWLSRKYTAEASQMVAIAFEIALEDERKRLADLIDRRARYLRSINATGSAEEWRSSDWWQGLEEAVDIIDGVFTGQFAPLTDDDDMR